MKLDVRCWHQTDQRGWSNDVRCSAWIGSGWQRVKPSGSGSPLEPRTKIGYLLLPGEKATYVTPFSQRLRELVYTEGKNLTIEYRSAEGRPERLGQLAADPSKWVAADSPVGGRPRCQR